MEEYNLLAHLDKFINIARMMDENIDGLSKRDAAELAISAIRRLSQDVGIPASITELAKRYGKEVSRSDIPTMVADVYKRQDWSFSAARGRPPVEGKHPLILLSHSCV